MHSNKEFLSHRKILWANRYAIFKGTLSLIFCDLLSFSLPFLIKLSIDSLQKKELPHYIPAFWRDLPPYAFLICVCLIYLANSAAVAYGRYWWRVHLIWSTFPLFHRVRMKFFQHLQRLNREFFKSQKVGDLLSALTTDTENVRNTLAIGALMAIDSFLYFLLIPFFLWKIDPQLTLLVITPLFLSSALAITLSKKLSARYKEVQDITGDLSARAFEMFSNVRIIKAFRKETPAHDAFMEKSKKLRDVSMIVAKYQSLQVPAMNFILGAAISFVLFYGGFKVIEGTMALGSFVAFQLYLAHMDWPMMSFGWFIQLYRQSEASQKRVRELQAISNPLLKEENVSSSSSTSLFEIKNLSYVYPSRNVELFHQLNFKIQRAGWIGLTGPVASGKSTLLELFSRQRDPSLGDIYYRGENLKSKSTEAWASEILYVPQESFMFSKSLRKNITMGLNRPIVDHALFELLADLSFDVKSLKERGGLDIRLGERGANFSGGQRQRISLGRALVRERSIYLLDDLFSHVDTETEAKLILSLKKRLPKNSTVILVSQRFETLLHCDEVIILENGKIEFQGKPSEASGRSAFFTGLENLQSSRKQEVRREV